MTALEWLHNTYKNDQYNIRPHAICEDGFTISIQGSSYLYYCEPRRTENRYEKVELGFPNRTPPVYIQPFAEETAFLNTVYPFVPIELVEQMITEHGGIKCIKQEKIE